MMSIVVLIYKFLSELHASNNKILSSFVSNSSSNNNSNNNRENIKNDIHSEFYALAQKYLLPFDKVYLNRNNNNFPKAMDLRN